MSGIWYDMVGVRQEVGMSKYRTTVYIEVEDKKRLESISRQTLIPEARLWREALQLLFEKRIGVPAETRSRVLQELRRTMKVHKIQEAYEEYKHEEKKLETKRGR